MESVNMRSDKFRIQQIVELRSRARESKHVADKSDFEQIFEKSCRQISGRAINSFHIKEG